MFKVNNKTPVVIVDFEHISQLVLVFLLLTLSTELLAGLFMLLAVAKLFQK